MKLVADEADSILRTIPNLTHPAAPIGGEAASKEIRRGNAAAAIQLQAARSRALAEKLDLVDFEGGAKVAGHGFYFLKNDAVLLELALQQYAIDLLINEGFTPTITPDLARNEILRASASSPAVRKRKSTASTTPI